MILPENGRRRRRVSFTQVWAEIEAVAARRGGAAARNEQLEDAVCPGNSSRYSMWRRNWMAHVRFRHCPAKPCRSAHRHHERVAAVRAILPSDRWIWFTDGRRPGMGVCGRRPSGGAATPRGGVGSPRDQWVGRAVGGSAGRVAGWVVRGPAGWSLPLSDRPGSVGAPVGCTGFAASSLSRTSQ